MKFVKRFWFPAAAIGLLAIVAINSSVLVRQHDADGSANADRQTDLIPSSVAENSTGKADAGDHEHHAPDHESHAAGEHAHGPMSGGRGMMGGGMMGKGMMGGGMAGMAEMRADMQDIHVLLSHHESVERTVKQLPNGVETVNTSSDPAVVPMLQKHVRVMHKRLKEKRGIRLMDPLFVAVFENADKIEMSITDLPDGVKVVETSQDAYVVRLIQEHARGVDRFVAEGMEAMHKTTPAPKRNEVAATAWATVEETKLSVPQRDQQQRAVAARVAMFEQLSGRLKAVIGEKGAAAAITVCGTDAPEIARQVAHEHGVAIGRTSFKLRNPKNTPPDWALPLIEKQPKQPMYAAHSDGRLAALLPILLKKECLACHGPRESLADDVRQAITKHYPDDQAISFAEGDLRGWFWVEVPSLATTQGSRLAPPEATPDSPRAKTEPARREGEILERV